MRGQYSLGGNGGDGYWWCALLRDFLCSQSVRVCMFFVFWHSLPASKRSTVCAVAVASAAAATLRMRVQMSSSNATTRYSAAVTCFDAWEFILITRCCQIFELAFMVRSGCCNVVCSSCRERLPSPSPAARIPMMRAVMTMGL